MTEPGEFDIGSYVRPIEGEWLTGDAVIVEELTDGWFIAVIDVLGHGAEANPLRTEIQSWLNDHAVSDILRLMQELHKNLINTRGAVAGFCFIDKGGRLNYVGNGNTVIRKIGVDERRLVSADGVLGQTMRVSKTDTLLINIGDTVLLYTDGVKSHFDINTHPEILTYRADDLAKSIIEYYGKSHDDAACIAIKRN